MPVAINLSAYTFVMCKIKAPYLLTSYDVITLLSQSASPFSCVTTNFGLLWRKKHAKTPSLGIRPSEQCDLLDKNMQTTQRIWTVFPASVKSCKTDR